MGIHSDIFAAQAVVGTLPFNKGGTGITTAIANEIFFAPASNSMGQINTANGGVLTTDSTGVPLIDNVNFNILSTGVRVKGNADGSVVPAGYIGEVIRSFVVQGSATSLSLGIPKTVTSIKLTPGNWILTAVANFTTPGAFTGTTLLSGISTTNNTYAGTTVGDTLLYNNTMPQTGSDENTVIASYPISVSTNTTYYLVTSAIFSVGSVSAYGKLQGLRIG
jgi:hypothetical protein